MSQIDLHFRHSYCRVSTNAAVLRAGVAELLGSFGDNEFFPELMTAIQRLWLRRPRSHPAAAGNDKQDSGSLPCGDGPAVRVDIIGHARVR